MFVKSNKNKKGKKVWYTHHIVESYKPTGRKHPKHRYLANITSLPDEVIEDIRACLKGDLVKKGEKIRFIQGDCVRGAGQVAVQRAWKKSGMEKALRPFTTEAQRQSVFAMVASRICNPSSKLALKNVCADTFWARTMSAGRLDEDTLYEVLDVIEASFAEIQQKLAGAGDQAPLLLLYDTTSTYFEGTKADGAEYGFSKDKRWDRYQIIVALVCDHNGCPLAVEVWPGNTVDVETVQKQIDLLRKRFCIEKAVFVGDQGMYSEGNLQHISEHGMDYIIGLEWHKKKDLLLSLSRGQQELFVREGVYEWEEDGVRHVGCYSECRRHRESRRREEAMEEARQELQNLMKSASQGRYYTRQRLWEKVRELLRKRKITSLWNITVEPLEDVEDPDKKILLNLSFSENQMEIKKRRAMDGCYIVTTTVDREEMCSQDVIKNYKSLQRVERGFRNIKSFIKIRPIRHRLWSRIRAHVLICFMAYYLVWWMKQELKEQGITTEVETLLQKWDQLGLSQTTVVTSEQKVTQWNWTLGKEGQRIKAEIENAGLWKSIDAFKSSATKMMM